MRLCLDLSTTLAIARFGRDDGKSGWAYSFVIPSEAKNLNRVHFLSYVARRSLISSVARNLIIFNISGYNKHALTGVFFRVENIADGAPQYGVLSKRASIISFRQ